MLHFFPKLFAIHYDLFYFIGGEKRKKSDDEEDLDDRLEDEDYDLLEENLGVKVERRVSKKI